MTKEGYRLHLGGRTTQERIFLTIAPFGTVIAVWLFLWGVPEASYRILFTEQGLVEMGTALLFVAAAVGALRLAARTDSAADRYRGFFLLYALAAVFVAAEEVSWGQHLFGWETPGWIADRNRQDETNVHNLFGNQVSEALRDVAYVFFVTGGVVLPAVLMRRSSAYRPDHWSFHLAPRMELVVPILLSLVATLPNKLPGMPRAGGHLRELTELYQAWAALGYVAVITARRRPEVSEDTGDPTDDEETSPG